jgi:hypothetical protein
VMPPALTLIDGMATETQGAHRGDLPRAA